MNLTDLKRAEAERKRMEEYENFMQAFSDMEVVGITVRRKGGGEGDNIELYRSHVSGGGGVTSFGFSQVFSEHMTTTLQDWIKFQRNNSQQELERMGVTVDPA